MQIRFEKKVVLTEYYTLTLQVVQPNERYTIFTVRVYMNGNAVDVVHDIKSLDDAITVGIYRINSFVRNGSFPAQDT